MYANALWELWEIKLFLKSLIIWLISAILSNNLIQFKILVFWSVLWNWIYSMVAVWE